MGQPPAGEAGDEYIEPRAQLGALPAVAAVAAAVVGDDLE